MSKREYIIIIGIFSLALTLRLIGISFGLPEPTLSDEFQLIERALHMGKGDLNPHLFTWPGHLPTYLLFSLFILKYITGLTLNFYKTTKDFLFHYFSNPTSFYLIARTLSALVGSVTIVLVYFIIREVFNKRTAIIGTLLLTLSYTHLRHSHFARPDIYAVFFTVVSFLLFIYAVKYERLSFLFLTGFVFGMGLASKFSVWILIVPLIVITLSIKKRRMIRIKHLIYLLLGILIGFFLFAPFFLIDFQHAKSDIVSQLTRLQSSRFGAYSNQFPFLFTTLLPHQLGIMITITLLPGFILLFNKPDRLKTFFIIYIVLFIVIVGTKRVPPHYFLPLFPVFSIISAHFIDRFLDLFNRIRRPLIKYSIIVIVLSLIFIQPSIKAIGLISNFKKTDTRTLARTYIESEIQEGEKILLESIQPDVESPQLYPTRQSIESLIEHSLSKGRFKFFYDNDDYPYGKRTFNLYTIQYLGEDWRNGIKEESIKYIVITKFYDRDFFYDQILESGDETYKGERDFHNYFKSNKIFKIIKSYNPGDKYRGPEIIIYEVCL